MKTKHHMFSHQYFHEVTVAREPEAVFDYVTNPNRWHEWFSASRPARIDLDPQQPGERFQLTTRFRWFSWLPLQLEQNVECEVSKSDRPYLWEVEAESPIIKAITSYTLSRVAEGTVLKRQFTYCFKGRYRYLERLLLRRRVSAQAQASLQLLKQRLEQQP